MRAVVVSKYGAPEGLRLKEIEKPSPKSNEVLVKVHATTVTFGDAMLRRMGRASRLVMGLFMGGLGKGKILGHEFAGVVEAIGTEASLFNSRDEVFGSAGMKGGTYAEYICVPEDSMVAVKPSNMNFEEAAAVPVGGHTALYILREANIQSNQKVLIYGASGSVGSYALQLAKYWGAEVTAVCSTSNVEWVRDLGADKVIDYTKNDFTQLGGTYDVIFDAVRKISKSQIIGLLKEKEMFFSTSQSTKEEAESLVFLRELIEDGRLTAVIDRRFPLEEIVEAHRHVDTGRKKGNVVITLDHL